MNVPEVFAKRKCDGQKRAVNVADCKRRARVRELLDVGVFCVREQSTAEGRAVAMLAHSE